MSKITIGLNDRDGRANDASLSQSGPGIPDHAGQPIEVSNEEAKRIRAKFEAEARAKVKAEIEEQIEKPQRGTA